MQAFIYTTGYTGQHFDALRPLLDRLGALLFDIRLSPRSRVPHWRGEALQRLLGESYRHLPALGNLNYKTEGEICIADLNFGIQEILRTGLPAVLLCACAKSESCHRRVVARELERMGARVIELNNWEEAAQQIPLIASERGEENVSHG